MLDDEADDDLDAREYDVIDEVNDDMVVVVVVDMPQLVEVDEVDDNLLKLLGCERDEYLYSAIQHLVITIWLDDVNIPVEIILYIAS